MVRSPSSSPRSCPPLWGTPRSPSRPTLGPRVAQIAAALGKPLMPWQQHVANVALEMIDGEKGPVPAYSQVILVVMRQQGKTELMLPFMTHRAIGFGSAQRIAYTTQTGSEARKKWEDIHIARLKASPFRDMFEPRLRLNAEAMIWTNGSFWFPLPPASKTGGTGDTLNLAVIDEGWSRPDNRTELSMRPAMVTQENRQLLICSMVPGISRAKTVDSVYLRQKMTMGRRLVENGITEGTAYFEWSAPEGRDPGDPATWWESMPALGHTITEATIRGDYETMLAEDKLVDFCAEYLGWWPQDNKPTWTIIRESTWARLTDTASSPAGRIALAVDVNPERTFATIAACGRREDGDYHVEIVEPGSQVPHGLGTLDWLEPRLLELIDKHEPMAVCLDPRGPARALLSPLQRHRPDLRIETPNALEVAAACARFYDLTGDNAQEFEPDAVRLRHLDQPELSRAISGARKMESRQNGTFVWVRVGASVNISPLYAATLAVHAYQLNEPGDNYDVLDSVAPAPGQCPLCSAYPMNGAPIIHSMTCPMGGR